MPHKYNPDRRHHIPKMSFKVQNWPEYEAGLRRRGRGKFKIRVYAACGINTFNLPQQPGQMFEKLRRKAAIHQRFGREDHCSRDGGTLHGRFECTRSRIRLALLMERILIFRHHGANSPRNGIKHLA